MPVKPAAASSVAPSIHQNPLRTQSPQFTPFCASAPYTQVATDQAVDCLIGQPPPPLQALHRPAFVNWFWQRVVARVQDPIEIDTSLGVRRVQVLGQAVYEFGPDGFITTALWKFGVVGPQREAIPEADMSAERTPCGDRWIEYFQETFVAAYAERSVFRIEDIQDYARWVFACFRNRLRRIHDIRDMRRKIALGLGIDPSLLKLARRIRLEVDYPRQPTRVNAYNHVIQYRDDYETLERETPNLVPLFAVCVGDEDFPAEGELTQRLRTYLRQHGFSPRLWRLLTHAKGRVLRGGPVC